MRVLFITEFFPALTSPIFSGGVETRMYYTAKGIAERQYVSVISARRPGELEFEQSADKRLTIMRLGLVPSEAATLLSLWRRFQFCLLVLVKGLYTPADVVEGSNVVTLFLAFVIAKFNKIPAIAWYPDTLVGQWRSHFGWLLGLFGESVEWLLLRLPWDQVVTISKTVNERLVQAGMRTKHITVVPCGIDHTCIQANQLGFGTKRKQMLVISRLVAYKRVDWAVTAFSHVVKKYPDYRLLIIGKGPEYLNLKFKVQNLKLSGSVFFKSDLPRQELYREIAQSELLIHPSLIEGFGIVMVEAAACGTPYVTADIATARELDHHLQAGWLFRATDLSGFTTQLLTALGSARLRQRFQSVGLKTSQHYDWDVFVRQTENLYLHLFKRTIS